VGAEIAAQKGRPVDGQVVVTGLGAVTPVGNDRESTWQALVKGVSGVDKIAAFDPSGLPTQIAGEVKGFDPAALLDTRRLRRSARFSQLAIAAGREAVADAGLVLDDGTRDRTGVVVNLAVAGMGEVEAATRQIARPDPPRLSPYYVSSVIPNMAACEVAIDLGVHGPVTASALACASGIYAFLEGRRLILSGEADVVVCGGTDASITPVMFAGLSSMGALSKRNDDPARASRPFDANRDGFVYGEGAVLAVLESAEHARARGARSYGTVAGGALTADAFHVSAPEPTATQTARAIRLALERSGFGPADVDYICAHGTSTRANDRTETAAIKAVFGPQAAAVAISSPKSMVGHLIGAAGSLSAMVSLLAMRDGVAPPTINLETPDPECDLDYVPNVARPMAIDVAMVNAFGFGGQNVVTVFTRGE
jgi:3-oxoacyl-[acyl-carrier-protein] synthase II